VWDTILKDTVPEKKKIDNSYNNHYNNPRTREWFAKELQLCFFIDSSFSFLNFAHYYVIETISTQKDQKMKNFN